MENIFSTPLLIVGLPLVLSLLLIVVGFLIWRELQKQPEAAWLKPYVFQAIVAAYKVSEVSVDQFGERLQGMDKQWVAEAAYNYLPPEVQNVVTRLQFATAVERIFAEAATLYETNAVSFQHTFEAWAWREENEEMTGGHSPALQQTAYLALEVDPIDPLSLAEVFHEAYERLAPGFGYETRAETKVFDPESQNGQLMVATCRAILEEMGLPVALPEGQEDA